MKERQGGFLISKIKAIGGADLTNIAAKEYQMPSTARKARFCICCGTTGR